MPNFMLVPKSVHIPLKKLASVAWPKPVTGTCLKGDKLPMWIISKYK